MTEAVIVEAVRTAIGRRGGKLSPVRPDDLLALTLRELVIRAGVDPAEVDDVIAGCVTQTGEQGMNIARASALIAGFPIEVPGTTINRFCGSGQQAVNFAAQGVLSGAQDVVIEAGQAIQEGRFAHEIFPVQVKQNGTSYEFAVDEGVRIPPSREKMAQLKPSFQEDGGVVTAGNSSQISDGAAAVLIMTREKAQQLGLKPRARIVAQAIVGSEPTIMLTGPIPATQKVLKKAGLQLKDIDLFEVNEAFAPIVLAWQHETGADMEKVNYSGGAIALGHPLGASGARLITTLLHELERQDARYGLSTMCIGYGMGIATVIERLNS